MKRGGGPRHVRMKLSAPRRPQPPPCRPLAELNSCLESTGSVGESRAIWEDWIWRSNPEEPFEPSILLNRSHLLGLMACRHAARRPKQDRGGDLPSDGRMSLVSKRPCDFSLRELRDSVDNLLIEWPQFVHRLPENPRAEDNLRAVASLVDGCFARLGQLAEEPADARTFDDAACTEPHGAGLIRLSRPGLRRFLGSFLVLYRHLDLLARAIPAPRAPASDYGVRRHHVEASTDDFHLICMHSQLPAAAKLNYKHDFPGMYNHVSQVIYFHNPQYERQQRAELSDILARGDPVQALPAICQLHPDVELAYEEDHLDLSAPTGKWKWLVLPRRVYLVDPDSRVHYSECVWDLLNIYLDRR